MKKQMSLSNSNVRVMQAGAKFSRGDSEFLRDYQTRLTELARVMTAGIMSLCAVNYYRSEDGELVEHEPKSSAPEYALAKDALWNIVTAGKAASEDDKPLAVNFKHCDPYLFKGEFTGKGKAVTALASQCDYLRQNGFLPIGGGEIFENYKGVERYQVMDLIFGKFKSWNTWNQKKKAEWQTEEDEIAGMREVLDTTARQAFSNWATPNDQYLSHKLYNQVRKGSKRLACNKTVLKEIPKRFQQADKQYTKEFADCFELWLLERDHQGTRDHARFKMPSQDTPCRIVLGHNYIQRANLYLKDGQCWLEFSIDGREFACRLTSSRGFLSTVTDIKPLDGSRHRVTFLKAGRLRECILKEMRLFYRDGLWRIDLQLNMLAALSRPPFSNQDAPKHSRQKDFEALPNYKNLVRANASLQGFKNGDPEQVLPGMRVMALDLGILNFAALSVGEVVSGTDGRWKINDRLSADMIVGPKAVGGVNDYSLSERIAELQHDLSFLSKRAIPFLRNWKDGEDCPGEDFFKSDEGTWKFPEREGMCRALLSCGKQTALSMIGEQIWPLRKAYGQIKAGRYFDNEPYLEAYRWLDFCERLRSLLKSWSRLGKTPRKRGEKAQHVMFGKMLDYSNGFRKNLLNKISRSIARFAIDNGVHVAVMENNLASFRTSKSQTRGKNRMLALWSQRGITTALKQQLEIEGILLTDVYGAYSSKIDAETGDWLFRDKGKDVKSVYCRRGDTVVCIDADENASQVLLGRYFSQMTNIITLNGLPYKGEFVICNNGKGDSLTSGDDDGITAKRTSKLLKECCGCDYGLLHKEKDGNYAVRGVSKSAYEEMWSAARGQELRAFYNHGGKMVDKDKHQALIQAIKDDYDMQEFVSRVG